VRIFRPHPVRLARALIVTSLFVAAGCGGGGSSNSTLPNPGSNAICDPNAASIAIARTPGSGQNTIEIVSSTDQDQLHGAPNQFDLNLRDNFGNVIVSGPLTLVADTGAPHPYTNDFYYSGTLQTAVQPGLTYTVFLNAPNTNCTPGIIGSFST
jgi:hypothetical protein